MGFEPGDVASVLWALLDRGAIQAVVQGPWRPGMLMSVEGRDVEPSYRLSLTVDDDDPEAGPVPYMGLPYATAFPAWGWPGRGSGWQPVLTDPATLGCLDAIFREATGAAPQGDSEADALVKGLVAALALAESREP